MFIVVVSARFHYITATRLDSVARVDIVVAVVGRRLLQDEIVATATGISHFQFAFGQSVEFCVLCVK